MAPRMWIFLLNRLSKLAKMSSFAIKKCSIIVLSLLSGCYI
ncbi:hypothetical protein PPHE_a1101 [Pseudoalteromonas phenolica O-BC30]|nr:hypothetical protein [Pseudoalteromonas phenolica O-BC30]